jgi:hypothetical protein
MYFMTEQTVFLKPLDSVNLLPFLLFSKTRASFQVLWRVGRKLTPPWVKFPCLGLFIYCRLSCFSPPFFDSYPSFFFLEPIIEKRKGLKRIIARPAPTPLLSLTKKLTFTVSFFIL